MAARDKPSRNARKCAEISRILLKEEARAQVRKIASILKTPPEQRTLEESQLLDQSADIASDIQKRARLRDLNKQRQLEVEDEDGVLKHKCRQLADAVRSAKSLVVYTGAGISTAASIPDYRGPNGVWTLLQKGQQPEAQDLSDAQPTYTHMSIVKLFRQSMVKYVVSQNCDGLHLRSGLPRHSLSEVHGNMYIEVCPDCEPKTEYVRLFDVTEKTSVRKHKTSRKCHKCNCDLKDTIVHFGEKGGHDVPYNWKEAGEAAEKADIILCLGSSLKVLKKYSCLWCMQRPLQKRPKLYVVNLQWTPKDEVARLKINGRCDKVMEYLMKELQLDVSGYNSHTDPIYRMGTPLRKGEEITTTKKVLIVPANYDSGVIQQADVSTASMPDALICNGKRKNSQTNGDSDMHLLLTDYARNSKKSRKDVDSSTNPVKHQTPNGGGIVEYKATMTNDGIVCGTDAMNYKRTEFKAKSKASKVESDVLILPPEKPFPNELKVNNWLMSQPSNPLVDVHDPPAEINVSPAVPPRANYLKDVKPDAYSGARITYPSIVCALQNANYMPMGIQALGPFLLPAPSSASASNSSVMQSLTLGFPIGFARGYSQSPLNCAHPGFAQLHPNNVMSSLPQSHTVSLHSQVPIPSVSLGNPAPKSTVTTVDVLSSNFEESQDKKVSNSSNAIVLSSRSGTPACDSPAPLLSSVLDPRLIDPTLTMDTPISVSQSLPIYTTQANHSFDRSDNMNLVHSIPEQFSATAAMSQPGWFGKGLNFKKSKKKRAK